MAKLLCPVTINVRDYKDFTPYNLEHYENSETLLEALECLFNKRSTISAIRVGFAKSEDNVLFLSTITVEVTKSWKRANFTEKRGKKPIKTKSDISWLMKDNKLNGISLDELYKYVKELSGN